MNLKAILKSDFKVALLIALAWQMLFTLIGILLTPNQSDILNHTMRWDSGWYMIVVNEHYAINAASAAFYPLFPLLVSIVSIVTFHIIPYSLIGLVINTVCLWLAIAALLKIAREFIPSKYRYLPVVFFLAAPAAFFMHLFYSEALFIAIGFWAYLFALKRQWLWVGVLLAFLTAARLPAILFVALCGLEYLRSYDWNIKKALNKNLAYLLLTPLGFVFFGLYLYIVRGDFFAMFAAYHATNDWSYQVFNPNFLYTIGSETYGTALTLFGHKFFPNGALINHAIPLFSLVLLLGCSLYTIIIRKGAGIPLGIFGILSVILFTLNSNVTSVHRYTLPCIVIYIALADIYVKYPRWRWAVIVFVCICVALQAYLVYKLWHGGVFVG